MKRSEALTKYYSKIAEDMVEHYRTVLECDGRIQYKLYIWQDGEIERLQGPQGDNSYLKPRDMEPRELFYICTIGESASFSIWDFAENGEPEDDTERDTQREEIIDWLAGEYAGNVRDVLDAIIEEAETDERYDI